MPLILVLVSWWFPHSIGVNLTPHQGHERRFGADPQIIGRTISLEMLEGGRAATDAGYEVIRCDAAGVYVSGRRRSTKQYPTRNPRLIARGTASIATVREIVRAVHPGTHVEQIESIESLVSRATAQPRLTTGLVMSFALLLAAVGIYGTLSYVVGSRTREIAIRMALGTSRGAIMSDGC